jgi:tetratricopeptide (TPR) repeat protein
MSRRFTIVLAAQVLLAALAVGQTAQEYLQRGEERAGAHQWKDAFAEYNRALQLNPDYAEAYNDRGHAYYWTGDYPKAIADFTRAIELRPNYPTAFNNRGAAYMASGKHRGDPRTIADFDQAIKLKPDFRNAYVNRANATLGSNWRGALDDFHRAGMYPERTAAKAGAGLLVLAGIGTFGLVRLRRRLAQRGEQFV